MGEWPDDQPEGLIDATAWLGNARLDASLYDAAWRNEWQIDRLVALVRDPMTIFLYWEVSDSRKRLIGEHFQSSWSDLPFELLVYDTAVMASHLDGEPLRRQAVVPQQSRAYVRELAPGGSFVVDLATKTIHGKSFTILRSEPAATPPLPKSQCGAPRALFARVGERRAELRERGLGPTVSLAAPSALGEDFEAPYPEQFDGYTVRPTRGGAGV